MHRQLKIIWSCLFWFSVSFKFSMRVSCRFIESIHAKDESWQQRGGQCIGLSGETKMTDTQGFITLFLESECHRWDGCWFHEKILCLLVHADGRWRGRIPSNGWWESVSLWILLKEVFAMNYLDESTTDRYWKTQAMRMNRHNPSESAWINYVVFYWVSWWMK